MHHPFSPVDKPRRVAVPARAEKHGEEAPKHTLSLLNFSTSTPLAYNLQIATVGGLRCVKILLSPPTLTVSVHLRGLFSKAANERAYPRRIPIPI